MQHACGSYRASPQKLFRFDDTFAHAKKRMLKGPGLVLRREVTANTKRQAKKTQNTSPCTSILMRTSINNSHALSSNSISELSPLLFGNLMMPFQLSCSLIPLPEFVSKSTKKLVKSSMKFLINPLGPRKTMF